MRALLIDADEQATIDRLVAWAIDHPFSVTDLEAATTAQDAALRQWKQRLDDYTMELPFGFLVTYTREQQPIGVCDHISISVDETHRIPHREALAMICAAFGMTTAVTMLRSPDLEHKAVVAVWPEEYDTGRIAVNIVALVQDEPDTRTP